MNITIGLFAVANLGMLVGTLTHNFVYGIGAAAALFCSLVAIALEIKKSGRGSN